MESSILKQIARFLQEQKKQKRWLVVFLCMAIIVGFGTVTALKMRGQAMTHKEKVVICQLAVHQHTDECYDEKKENVVCGYADYVVHVHNDDCYDWNGNLTCQLPEVEKHEHSEECYTEERTLICGQEEAAGHQHGAECYTRQQGGLVCQIPEHTHAEECYDETGAVICGLEEHAHEDACYEWTDVLTCPLAEGADGHTHTDACYEVKNVLSCGKLELHTHTDECYEKINEEEELSETNRRLICTIPVLEEHIHTEDAGCFEIVEVTANGELVEEENAEAESEEEIFTTDLDGEEANDEVEGEETAEADIEGTETEQKTYEEMKTYEGDGYVVTVSYNKDANIPEEAELIAEQVTEENDEEEFSKHAADFQNMMEDKSNTMEYLFKIGFYVDGKEVEPDSPVLITIQFLDENGLPESAPVTVVHFGDEENEILDGSEVENGSTSFETGSFSYFGMRAKQKKIVEKDGKVYVSESFEYESGLLHVKFHVEGNATLLEEKNDEKHTGKDSRYEETEESTTGEVTGEKEETDETDTKEEMEEESGEVVEDDSTTESEESDAGEENVSPDEELDEEGDAATDTDIGAGSSEVIQGFDEKFQLRVDTLDEKSKEYEMVDKYAKRKGESGDLFQMQVLSYSLSYDNREADVSDCDVTVEIIPGEELTAQVEEIINDESDQRSVTLATYELTEDTVNKKEDKVITEETLSEPIVCTLNNSRMAVRSNIEANPGYTVQYYAYMKVVETDESPVDSGNGSIQLIDTSAKGNGKGKAVLPVNGNQNLKTMNIKIKDSGEEGTLIDPDKGGKSNIYDIDYGESKKLLPIYTEQNFQFKDYPELNNVNKFAVENPHYKLKEIWKWTGEKSDTDINSTEASEKWKIYRNINEVIFTNNPSAEQENPQNTILIEKDTIIRLVAESEEGTHNNHVAFYDYDITDGEVYTDEKLENKGDRNSEGVLYANTNRKGINSESNYTKNEKPRYGFGNILGEDSEGKKVGVTGINEDMYNSYYINRANSESFGNCSFGLVANTLAGSGSNVYPQFNVNAPKLFGSGGDTTVTGQTVIPGYSLDFKRDGDTYTLTAVNGSSTATELERFQHRMNWNGTKKLWTNSFWPMDSSTETYGTPGHDLVFGDKLKVEKRKAVGETSKATFPTGDDGKDHNSYFGMNFAVDFELTKDYVGPLNYYFFGDDDMWVFLCPLDEENNMKVEESQLVCDIGGVHSSVGEYVDLRDYLPNGTAGKYALVFFYTERGASGSTCWMQFTLPSVNTRPVTGITGDLKNTLTVRKTVDGPVQEGQKFKFGIKFVNQNGVDLINYYTYTIIDASGNVVKRDSIGTGGEFFLEKDQSITVGNLPDGTKYTIEEKDFGGYRPAITGNGEIEVDGGVSEGEIDWDDDYYQDISYVNVYDYELPETGGYGPIIYTMAGVLVILTGAGFMYRKKVRERRV